MPYFGIFGLEFETTTVIFEISTFELFLLQNFAKEQVSLNFRPKNDLFGYFWATI